MGRAQPRRRTPGGEQIRRLIGKPRHLPVQHRHIDVLPLAVLRPVMRRRHYGEGGPHPGADVGYGNPHLLRLPVRLPGEAHQPAHALHNLVIGRQAAVGAILPEAGYGGVDDARVDRLHHIIPQPETLHHAGGEVFHNNIGIGGQLQENFPRLGFLEVQGKAALVAVDRQKIGAFALDKGRPPMPGVIAAARNFDFNDLGPVVAQHQSAKGAGQRPGKIQHFQPFQRAHSLPISCQSAANRNICRHNLTTGKPVAGSPRRR